jgi:23S rRNA pseudouridine2605 synthase
MSNDPKKPSGGKGGRPGGGSAGKRGPGKPWTEGRKPRPAGADGPTRPAAFGKPTRREDGDRQLSKPGFAPKDRPRGDRPFRERPAGDRPAAAWREKREGGDAQAASAEGGRFRRDDKPCPARFEDKPRPARFEDKPRPARFEDKPRKPAGAGGFRGPRIAERDAPADDGERIAKRLARVGIASRRDAEELIAAGRVKVNGTVLTSPAFNVRPDDRIELDGTEIPPVERTRLFLFNKPAGLVTTNRDPEGRKTVFDALPEGLPRLITVGRLDINTEGLLLLTNDGGLARVLELPATGWLRRYRVRVHGKVEQETLDGLRDGIAVDGVFYGSVEASLDREQGSNAWLTIGLREGKNREVKNILGALGLEVSRLIRISFGPFQLGELEEGHVLEVKGRTLRDQLGERLIEESGANFEAEIATPFSNRPVRASRKPEPVEPEKPARPRRDTLGAPGEGGLIKRRRMDRQDEREKVLGRLTTKPQGKPRGGKRDREEKAPEPKRPRGANVWMAPGARPQGRKKDAAVPARTPRGEGQGQGRNFASEKAGGAPRTRREDGPPSGARAPSPRKPGPGSGPRKGRGDADRRR